MAYLTSPVGRIVQGDPNKMEQKKDDFGKLKLRADGTPDMGMYVGIAIPKTDPEWPAFHAQMVAEARAAWPQFFNAAGQCTHPQFAWKIIDGDGADKKGKPYARNDGFAGHWVLKLSSNFPTTCFAAQGGAWYETTTIKRGDYVRASFEYVTNASTQSEGMYANLKMIAFQRLGDPIVITSGPSANEAFGAPPPDSGAAAGGFTAPAVTPPPLAAGAPASATAGAGSPPPPPHTSFMQPPPPPAPAHVMLPAANGIAYEAYLAGGWTHAQLVAAGMIAA